MVNFILAIISLGLAAFAASVRQTYSHLPLSELKRRAEKSELPAAKLYPVAAYGASLRLLLLFAITLASAGGAVLLGGSDLPTWLSWPIIAAFLLVVFVWLPRGAPSTLELRLGSLVAPALLWLLNYAHPLLERMASFTGTHRSRTHTGLFERVDLLRLIEHQKKQPDSRFSQQELEMAERALKFDEYSVADVLTPRQHIKTVLGGDTVGPVLINELHENGQQVTLVRDTAEGDIVGTLDPKRLNLHSSGQVRDFMNAPVCYLHEQDKLPAALQAFAATHSSLFVVVNSAEEYVGTASLQQIVQQLSGQLPDSDFDQYSELPAVAARHTKKQAADAVADDEMVIIDGEVVE